MKILDVTLRDGSYAINFGFTANDTAAICSALEGAGFEWIEIGHGIGLHASEAGCGEASESDAEYLKAAAGALSSAKFGMFCIPGIARLEDVDMAAEHGMGFIRIGTNVTEVEESAPFIERAREHGMFVAANFMKSYVLEPKAFAEQAKKSAGFGAEVVYLVDSAGGMLPADVIAYYEAVHSVTEVGLAFHGHDNLGLSIANTLAAVEMGAPWVDTSLQGLGRSAGNAPTEVLVAALDRLGIDTGIDLFKTMDAGEKYIRSLVKRQGHASLDVITGLSQFHSSYMGVIKKFSSKYKVDPRRLIQEVCKEDKVDAPEELVEKIARQIREKDSDVITARYEFDRYFGHEQDR